MVNKALFLGGGGIGGVPLDSHEKMGLTNSPSKMEKLSKDHLQDGWFLLSTFGVIKW